MLLTVVTESFEFQNELINPRIESMKEGRISRDREPIGVRRKDFWDTSRTRHLLSDRFKNALSHEPDGLIYQPVDAVRLYLLFNYSFK